MKSIPLTRGFVALVDDEDFDWLNQFKWSVNPSYGNHYARSCTKGKSEYMHRLILKVKPGEFTDHIDGDGLNNTRRNLRLATQSQNMENRNKTCMNTSGFKGVHYSHQKGNIKKPWMATICINYRNLHLGYFSTAEEAAVAYDEAAIKYFREFAKTNFGI